MLNLLFGFYIATRVIGELMLELLLYSFWLPFWKESALFVYYYLRKDPYATMHQYLQEKESSEEPDSIQRENFVYGPTPLSSLHYILRRSGVQKGAHIFDFGCGSGRGCLFMAKKWRSRVVGIDLNPYFIETAQKIREKVENESVTFIHGDILSIDVRDADLIYMYCTTWHQELLLRLAQKFERELHEGARIITVSQTLPDTGSALILQDHFHANYLEGKRKVFVYRVSGPPDGHTPAAESPNA